MMCKYLQKQANIPRFGVSTVGMQCVGFATHKSPALFSCLYIYDWGIYDAI